MELPELKQKMETLVPSGKSDEELIKLSCDISMSHEYDPVYGSTEILEYIQHELERLKHLTKYLRRKETSQEEIKLPIHCHTIPSKYGQLIVTIEELMELGIEIIRGINSEDNLLELTEELADVRCVLEYVIRSFPIKKEDISKIHEIKYLRSIEREENDDLN